MCGHEYSQDQFLCDRCAALNKNYKEKAPLQKPRKVTDAEIEEAYARARELMADFKRMHRKIDALYAQREYQKTATHRIKCQMCSRWYFSNTPNCPRCNMVNPLVSNPQNIQVEIQPLETKTKFNKVVCSVCDNIYADYNEFCTFCSIRNPHYKNPEATPEPRQSTPDPRVEEKQPLNPPQKLKQCPVCDEQYFGEQCPVCKIIKKDTQPPDDQPDHEDGCTCKDCIIQ
jgi:hypothetical protein